jgi:hypothetical protein
MPAGAPITIISRFGFSMDKVLMNQSRLEGYQALTIYSDRFLYRRAATSPGFGAKLVAGGDMTARLPADIEEEATDIHVRI